LFVNTNNYNVDKCAKYWQLRMWMIVDKLCGGTDRQVYPQFLNILFHGLDHSSAFDGLHQDMQVVIEPGVFCAQVYDGAAGVHHGGMVATAKGFAYFRQAV
jgi:hypothetical protein